MSVNAKIFLSAVISAIVVTLLFVAIPITDTSVICYVFTLIAISCIVGTILFFGKGKSNSIVRLSYIYTALFYGIINILFSIVACLIHLLALWTAIIHIAWLAFFAIRIIVSSVGSKYISTLDDLTSDKRKKFQDEKNKYWDK